MLTLFARHTHTNVYRKEKEVQTQKGAGLVDTYFEIGQPLASNDNGTTTGSIGALQPTTHACEFAIC
jgi:hypothetical protein